MPKNKTVLSRRSIAVPPARPGVLVGEILTVIRDRILCGELAAAQPIREAALAAELGVSRAPVREALRLLEARGIVVKTPRSSYAVVKISERDVVELTTLRVALEMLAANLAFGRAQLVPQLELALETMALAVRNADIPAVLSADRAFHQVIIDVADHKRLAVAYARLSDEVELSYRTYPQRKPNVTHIVKNHAILVEMARTGDEDRFLQELGRHIRTQISILLNAR